jgi:hypothetical protein
MRTLTTLCSMLVALATFALTVNGAFAGTLNDSKNIGDDAAKGQASEGTLNPPTTCLAGEALNLTTSKCMAIDSVNYNSSESNTGNPTATPTTQCPNGEVMVSGKCM